MEFPYYSVFVKILAVVASLCLYFGIFAWRESVTQCDTLSVFMYAIGTLPMKLSLHNSAQWSQICYVDNASVCGHLENFNFMSGFSDLFSGTSDFGYFPEPSKSFCLILRNIGLLHNNYLVTYIGV